MPRLSFGGADDLYEHQTHDELELELSQNKQPKEKTPFNVLEEAGKLFHVALPSVLIQFSLFFFFLISASAVGRRLGTTALGGFSLGCLIGNLTCLSIMEGALTAADTLMPRAFAAKKYEEVGCLAVRAFFVCSMMLLVAFVPLMTVAGKILQTLGQDPEASQLAEEWIRYYFIGAPANLVFRVIMRFLLAQHKPWYMAVSSFVPGFLIHPFLLTSLVTSMGLSGSALAISLTQWIMAAFLITLVYYRPQHHRSTWPGLSMEFVKKSLQMKPLREFLHLSFGGILSMNEWWFFEIMCFIAGSFGVVPLCIHTIAYNLVPLLFMLPLGLSIGLIVRIGQHLVHDSSKAVKIAQYVILFSAICGLIVVLLLYTFQHEIVTSFSNDEEVIEGATHIWVQLCIYIFCLYIFGMNQGIMRALGMQWRLAAVISGFLFFVVLPAVAYFAVYRGGGLYTQWTVLACCYIIFQVILVFGYIREDWEDHSRAIRASMFESIRRSSKIQQGIALEPTERDALLGVM